MNYKFKSNNFFSLFIFVYSNFFHKRLKDLI